MYSVKKRHDVEARAISRLYTTGQPLLQATNAQSIWFEW